jgi:uncharacterized repeat protein (TIGR02543 family)
MKRFVSILLILTLLVSLGSEVQAANNTVFATSDMVPKDYWSYEALSAAIDTGLLQGDMGQIKPHDKLTRAEMLTMVLRALGISSSKGQDFTSYQADIRVFTDVKETDWFNNQIAIAYRLKLIDGISSTKMFPKGTVTREQAFTILSRLMSLNGSTADISVLNRFKDQDTLSSWAKPYVAALVSAGYVSGYKGRLNPGDAITRQDFAQLMYNLFHRNMISSQEIANTLDHQSITGNLVVCTGGITLSNLNVAGDLIIGDGVGDGNVTLDHVVISGRLIVRGGGEHSIYLRSTSASTVIVNKLSDGGIRLYGDDGSEVSYMEIPDGKDTVIIECSVTNLILSNNNLDIIVNETVKNISLSGDNVHISGSGTVGTITLEKGVRKVTLGTANTNVINHSQTDVTVVDKNGTPVIVSSGTSITANTITTNTITTNIVTTNSKTPVTKYTVSFHSNGGGTLNPLTVTSGYSLGELPVPQKETSIFLGWFTDDMTFENGVTADTPVQSNMDLYASYMDSTPMTESNMQTTTSVMDVAPNYVITILSSDAAMTADAVEAGITLQTISENDTDFGGISVTGSDGTYSITAKNGYTAACSYAIILNNDNLHFKDESSTVRTYNLSVEMSEPVLNLKLNSTVKLIPANDITLVTQNGQPVESLFAPLYNTQDNTPVANLYGTFVYSGSQGLSIGDQLAVYEGTSPDERIATENYTDEPISYLTITGMNGSTISYGNTDATEVLFTPDILPIRSEDDQDGDANNNSLTIAVSKLTFTGEDFASMGLDASTTVDSGDFIAFYDGTLDSAELGSYARIVGVTTIGDYYIIQYAVVSASDVLTSMDMSSSSDLNYEQLSENVNLEDEETVIKQQVEDSGFAEAASNYLVALAQADEGTREQLCDTIGIQNFSATNTPLAAGLLSDSAPKVTVKATISKNLEHYSGAGMHCEVTVTCAVELGDNMALTVSGTFVEEYKVTLSISSKTIWKYKWSIFPYISDYTVSANIDLYNYTYLALNMALTSNNSEGWSDGLNIKDSIDDLKDLTSSSKANSEVQRFYETYQAMLAQDHGYFDLFDKEISSVTGGIDPLHILGYGFGVNFVVSLDADVALGTEFGYEKATRYCFTLNVFAATATNSETTLVDEQYNFSVYAMGMLGIRAGIRMKLEVGLFDVSLDSIGITAEVGAYWQIWGFVYYKLNHKNNVTTTESGGACYMELGIYLSISFIAGVGGGKLVGYNTTLYDHSWPLWSAGSQHYTYDFNYRLTNNEDYIHLKGDDYFYTIPSSAYYMARMDLKSGDVSGKVYDADNFSYTVKDDPEHVFTVSKTGIVFVKQPKKSDIAKATLEITWSQGPLSFTSVPISRTFTLIWDNLASSYIIGFDSNGGSHVGSISGAYGSAISSPTPIRAGYLFGGWYTDKDTLQERFLETRMPAANYRLYAKWIAFKAGYTVRHYQENADGSGYTLVDTDKYLGTTESNITPAVKSYTGFQSPVTQTITVSGDSSSVVSYYYLRNSYTLTFTPVNGSGNNVSSLKYGDVIAAPNVIKSGYTFTGWNTTIASTMPAHDLTYTAQWSLSTYTLSYDIAGGSLGSPNPLNFTINSASFTLTNPTKPGYNFAGWTGTKLSSPTTTVTIASGSTDNRYYTATWKPLTDTRYSVYHYREDLSGSFTIIEAESLKGTTGSNTSASAKTYTGFTAGIVAQKSITADEKTFVAINYTRNSYTLTFDANGGVGGNTASVKYDADISAPSVTRAGCVFVGWNTQVPLKMPAANTTYTAQWTANNDTITYTITFDKNAADATGSMNDQSFSYDSAQSLTANAYSRDGYLFDGWNTAADGSGTDYANNATVTNLISVNGGTLTLYAKWKNATITYGIFNVKYSAKYQVFDFIMYSSKINGNAFDPSWGSAGASSGHQFSDPMLSGRYFTIRKTGDDTRPIALYMYESNGTPVLAGTSANLSANSLIGSASNISLTASCMTSLQSRYGADWANGLVAVGNIGTLWSEGFMFTSSNGFGFFISGKTAYMTTGTLTLNNMISNPTLSQLDAVSDYLEGPLN